MTYQAASGAGAQNMRELLQQMGEAHLAAKALLDDPASSILDIDREVAGILRDERFPTEHFGVPLAGSLIPWIDKDLGNGMSREEWKGGAEANKILGPRAERDSVESICVRIGAMRCHAQALTIKLRRDIPLAEIERVLADAHEWVRVIPNDRDASIRGLTPAAVTGRLEIPIGRLRKLAMGPEYLAPSRAATSCCGARRSRCAGCCGSSSADSRSAGGIDGIQPSRRKFQSPRLISGSFMQAD